MLPRLRLFLGLAVTLAQATTLGAQEQGKKASAGRDNPAAGVVVTSPRAQVLAVRTPRPPVVDGNLNDEIWELAPAASGFTQLDPEEGKPASERSEIRILYDDDAIYVAARMFDSEPRLIGSRLSTRDSDADADRITIYLDSMHDHLTGALFRVSAANVQKDAIIYNDSWTDSTWDAVWQSRVSIDDLGWAAELRIPLSQLRFARADQQIWGVNVDRYIRRKNETAWLEMVPKNETGLASRMVELTGLDGLQPARRLELLPYTVARQELITPQKAGNPFNDGSRTFASAGVDVKWGLTSNLTVNATVNPDFGQVEVDPAVVNLSAFETFFEEKRAFFLEGAQILNNFGQGGSNSFWGFNTSDPAIFYSRRIGRAPQLAAGGDYSDPPTATTILGAAKLTGKTGGGWSIGFLEAVTDREMASTQFGSVRGTTPVEPLTNYSVVRVQREIGRRGGAGFIATSVNRRLDTNTLRDGLADQAQVVGTDAYIFFDKKRDWVLTGKIAGSRIAGTSTVIERAQRAPQRYYQRPDAPHVDFDPARTSLTGFTGRVNLNRNSGAWQVNAALWGVSPGFESNDLGFHGTGDRAGGHGVFFWKGVKPNRFARSRSMWVAKWYTWNFNRELQGDGFNSRINLQFLNYWNFGANYGFQREVFDDRLTRGGPSTTRPGSGFWNVDGGTDNRKRLSLGGNWNRGWSDSGGWNNNASLSLSIKPSPKVTLSTGPQWNQQHIIAQYVRSQSDATAVDTYGGRYVFGALDQRQLTLTTRASLVLGPTMSFQVYAQPLLASGDYSDFKELARPRTFDFLHYGTGASTLALNSASRIYTADPDGADGAAPSFSFGDPDFNLKSLRVNAVFRWEFKPGSNFYAVWTRQQQDFANPGTFVLARDARAMFGAPGDDVFLVKFAYWIGR